jgi:CPA2 family monovalent cation:H+ antiporter-2
MTEIEVLRDILVIFSVSIGVVFLFQKLHLPSIAGFLVAGTLVGPYGLNLVSDVEQVQVLAEIGVILLLFTIGMEFSLTQIRTSRNLFLLGGPVQLLGVIGLVLIGGLLVGLTFQQALFWGLLLSLSSTAIVLKALAERRENDTLHGRSTIGILIFIDCHRGTSGGPLAS